MNYYGFTITYYGLLCLRTFYYGESMVKYNILWFTMAYYDLL